MLSDESKQAEGGIPCQICVKSACVYTCPRCNVRYCSVACYRSDKHAACSEAFYKECVIDGLKDQTTRPEERQKVLEMLQRLDDDVPPLDSDEDDVEGLQERIAGLDLDHDTDEIWQRLTETERSEFKSMLHDGRLANLVETWTPWWTHRDSKLVHEVNPEEKPSEVPPILKNIPDINHILKNKKPSADMRNNVVNVLYCYAYIVRLYNGAHWDNAQDSVTELVEICDVFNSNTSFSCPRDAVHACVKTLNETTESNRHFHISLIQDVCSIIHGPNNTDPLSYILSALSDVSRLIESLVKAMRRGKKKEQNSHNLKDIFRAHKKCEFFVSWAHRYGLALRTTIDELNLEICALSSDLAVVEKTKDVIEKDWQKRNELDDKPPLIQEM